MTYFVNTQYQYAPIPLDCIMMDVIERDRKLKFERTRY